MHERECICITRLQALGIETLSLFSARDAVDFAYVTTYLASPRVCKARCARERKPEYDVERVAHNALHASVAELFATLVAVH